MNKRQIATILFGLVGVLELGDFVANLTILTSESRSQQAAALLGDITLEQMFPRTLVIVVWTLVISALCLATAFGFHRNLVLKGAYTWAAISLVIYALFHFVTAITLPAATFAWFVGAAYGLAAALTYVAGRRAL